MPSADDTSSARPKGTGASRDDLAFYKTQYEQLEAELADFQASSRELETELEKDIEASEKRERQLKEKVDNLRYEVDEWKSKYKQAKTEGGSAQNSLQKEITTLRETNRSLQLKIRDIEVVNDDFERQARHTTSSLEDLESKYNMAIERGVLLEEEIRSGEQEREKLRIANQRLKDEFSDLKIENEIVQERLRNAEGHASRRRKPTPLQRTPSTPQTPEIFDRSPEGSTMSSPFFATPPMRSLITSTATPPSPPMSETSSNLRKSLNATPGFPRQKASAPSELGSRSMYDTRTKRFTHSRATSLAYSNGRSTPSFAPRSSLQKPAAPEPTPRPALPQSGSLYQIRGLIGKMQKLEERVHTARSKLPAPSPSPSRASSRAGSVLADSPVSSTITMRRDSRKRLSGSSFSSSVHADSIPSYHRPTYSARTQGDSRPSSRTSYSSTFSHSTHPSVAPSTRPESRQSRTKTPLGHYSTNPTTESRRPRSSLSNPSGQNGPVNGMSHIDEDEDLSLRMSMQAKINEARQTRLPSFSTPAFSTPNGLKKKRAPSGMSSIPTPRTMRANTGPSEPKANGDLGETF